jgi:hypothetical protein
MSFHAQQQEPLEPVQAFCALPRVPYLNVAMIQHHKHLSLDLLLPQGFSSGSASSSLSAAAAPDGFSNAKQSAVRPRPSGRKAMRSTAE